MLYNLPSLNQCCFYVREDGKCDKECDIEWGYWDGGDCGTCPPGWKGDGYCDPWCNTEEYDYDGGDCKSKPDLDCSEKGDNGICEEECNTQALWGDGGDCTTCWLANGDGECDSDCNAEEFNYDGGDCSMGVAQQRQHQ